jgi:hypothetical protein
MDVFVGTTGQYRLTDLHPLFIGYFLQARSLSLSRKGTHVGLSAAVERGPSQGARSGSTGPTWVSFQSLSSWGYREQVRTKPGPSFFLLPSC